MSEIERESTVAENRAADLLTEDQLRALGEVAAEFGLLEASLRHHITQVTRINPVYYRVISGAPGARRMAEIMEMLAPLHLAKYPDALKRFQAAYLEVKRLSDARHDLLHAAWGSIDDARGWVAVTSPPSDPNFAWLIKQGGRKYHDFTPTAQSMRQTAAEIAAVRLEVNRIQIALPYPMGMADYEHSEICKIFERQHAEWKANSGKS